MWLAFGQTGAKGITYDPEFGCWTAALYRYGHRYGIGSFRTREQAEEAYQDALRKENPELHTAPAVVERPVEPRPEPVERCAVNAP